MLTGQELREIIAARKFREKLVRIEARVGEGPPPLLALAAAQASLTGEFTIEELDAEIARCRERRKKRVAINAGSGPR